MFQKIKQLITRQRTLVYCGVNHGHTFRKIFEKFDRAIGFEPIPELYQRLQKEFSGYPQVEMVHGALSTANGTVTFNIHDFDPASSIGTLSDSYRQRHDRDFQVVQSLEVPAYHLGDFLAKRGIKHVDTLVTDVQGYDLAVVKTIDKLVRSRAIRTIKCEVEQDKIPQSYENIPSNKEKEFFDFLGEDYQLVHRYGEPDWSFNDLTWVRTGEKNQTVYA